MRIRKTARRRRSYYFLVVPLNFDNNAVAMTTENSGQPQVTLVDADALNEQLNTARSFHAESAELVKGYREELIRTHGVEIRYKKTALPSLCGLVEFSWVHNRDHHLVWLHSGLKKNHEPHVRAHELTHIAMASEARNGLGYVPSFRPILL